MYANLSSRLTRASKFNWVAVSFVFWFVFMAALTPGNIQNSSGGEFEADLRHELVRLIGAAVLGASVMPILLRIAHSKNLKCRAVWTKLLIYFGIVSALAAGLIIVSCFLASWVFLRVLLPDFESIIRQISADFFLLIFGLSVLLSVILLVARNNSVAPEAEKWLERIQVSERGKTIWIAINEIDSIESQGNYQALHTCAGVHLVRITSSQLESRLDPSRFARIHRRQIVALDRVRAIEKSASGDAVVCLKNGAKLKHTQRYRKRLRDALGQ